MARYFSSKDGFLGRLQRNTIHGLQLWQAMYMSFHRKGRRTLLYRRKESWEGYGKQRVHGFSLAESLPGKNMNLSSSFLVLLLFLNQTWPTHLMGSNYYSASLIFFSSVPSTQHGPPSHQLFSETARPSIPRAKCLLGLLQDR